MGYCYFSMSMQKIGMLKYTLLALIPSIIVGFLITIDGGAFVFILLCGMLVFRKNHKIVVFENMLTEKDFRGRFICNVQVTRISHFRVNILNEIILLDTDNHILLCVEPYMTNRDLFERWIASHNINQYKGEHRK